MIYITQFIFIKKGKEDIFEQFETNALAQLKKHNGRLIYRIRPAQESLIDGDQKFPYEIHLVSFDSENDWNKYLQDDIRKNYLHLKEDSVESAILIKGEQI